MESEIRGLIEKEIEHITRIDILEGFAEATQKDFPTKSMKDCLFGFVLGYILGCFAHLIQIKKGRRPTDDEIKEFWETLKKRAIQIRGNIELALGR